MYWRRILLKLINKIKIFCNELKMLLGALKYNLNRQVMMKKMISIITINIFKNVYIYLFIIWRYVWNWNILLFKTLNNDANVIIWSVNTEGFKSVKTVIHPGPLSIVINYCYYKCPIQKSKSCRCYYQVLTKLVNNPKFLSPWFKINWQSIWIFVWSMKLQTLYYSIVYLVDIK